MVHSKYITDSLETTLAIIKPDAMASRKDIIRKILKSGFVILYSKKFQLSPEQAADFLKERERDKNFSILVYSLSSGPIEILILNKDDGINDFLLLLGPEKPSYARLYCPHTIRAIFGDQNDDFRNAVHGSASMDDARREIHFFHPNFIYEPIRRIKSKKGICCYRNIIEPLMDGLHHFVKDKPIEPYTWMVQFLTENNKNYPLISEALPPRPCDKPCREPVEQSESICSSFRDDSVSSILNSIMSSSSITASSSTLCQKPDEPSTSSSHNLRNEKVDAGSNTCCECISGDPHICPNCEKLLKIPVPNFEASTLNKKLHCHAKCVSKSNHSGPISTGTSTNPICNAKTNKKDKSSTSSSSIIKHL